jgi:hypothetical protein
MTRDDDRGTTGGGAALVDADPLDDPLAWLRRSCAAASAALLAGGLTVHLLRGPDDAGARRLLEAGIATLLATPALSVALSFIEHVRRKDVRFAAVALAVLAILGASMFLAFR